MSIIVNDDLIDSLPYLNDFTEVTLIPLIDMMNQSGNGEAMSRFAQQFGLDPGQVERAMEALTPAFSEGLKRNAADPAGFLQFMRALADGKHAQYYMNPAAAMSESGIAEGNAILGHLFGSKEMSRAIAEQAAQYSQLSQDVMKKMLPAMAPMILGGLYNQMSAGSAKTAGDISVNPLGWLLEQMAGGESRGSGGVNPWGDMIDRMWRGEVPGGSRRESADNPWGPIFEEMMRGGGQSAERRGDDRGRHTPQERRGGGLDDIFGDMFETGRSVQNEYQRNLETIFDEFLPGGKRR
jgi:hypothetical protein